MNRIDEDKLNELHEKMRGVVGEDCVIVTLKNWNRDVDDHKRLLSKLEIAENALKEIASNAIVPWIIGEAEKALKQIKEPG